jgi:hypothetical protein
VSLGTVTGDTPDPPPFRVGHRQQWLPRAKDHEKRVVAALARAHKGPAERGVEPPSFK